MQRNPYLILGVPFGTHRDDARRAFAFAAKRLRANSDGPYAVEDLTWALQEIESLDKDPENMVDHFRVPADPVVFHVDGPGVFRPDPRCMGRRTTPNDCPSLDRLRIEAATEILELIIREYSGGVDIDLAYDT
jgi:hypothetical protein